MVCVQIGAAQYPITATAWSSTMQASVALLIGKQSEDYRRDCRLLDQALSTVGKIAYRGFPSTANPRSGKLHRHCGNGLPQPS